MKSGSAKRFSPWALVPLMLGLTVGLGVVSIAAPAATATAATKASGRPFTLVPAAVGGLDCNGYSPVQRTLLPPNACTDVRGDIRVDNQYTWGGRFYDNGHYIGHDEPDMAFFSGQAGSGDDVNWSETLPVEPTAAPTVSTPGSDVMHTVELTVAPWFGMDLCDGASYPQLPCTPQSDSNAPSCAGVGCSANAYPGGGSAFLEMQFYPPGEAPFVENISCDNSHWCASLHINELECTAGFQSCNTSCEETTNFAFVQRNGVPTGPPSPQGMDEASGTPNGETLLMSPGDKLKIHIWDAPAPGVKAAGIPPGRALEVSIDDVTSGESGYMQASAANGFAQTDMQTCNGRLFNFEPEYSTSEPQNIVPWAAIAANVSTEFEIGHFEPCTTVTKSIGDGFGGSSDPVYDSCTGPYEAVGSDTASSNPESAGEAYCYPKGDTHGTLGSEQNIVGGCQDNLFVNGDLDYDGSPYYTTDWPTATTIDQATSRVPSSFVQSLPTTHRHAYPQFMFQSDAALSEGPCQAATPAGCTIPPSGSYVNTASRTAGYPFWSERDSGGRCTIDFGDVTSGVNDFGGAAQYGTNRFSTLGYPEFEGTVYSNTCPAAPSQGYYLAGQAGGVVAGGDAPPLPSVHAPAAPVVSIAATSSGKGYCAVTDTGVVSTAGDAAFEGDLTTLSPPVSVSDVVAVVPTADMGGYWLLGRDGGMFAFGDARYLGSLPGDGVHVSDVVGMVASPSGRGYLVAAADGGVFAFGDAKYRGSLPQLGVHVGNVAGIAGAPSGGGYLLVGRDGGVFAFGSGAPYHGSLPGEGVAANDLAGPIVGIALTSDAGGYWMAGSDGTVFHFGDARALPSSFDGSQVPITSITGVRTDVADLGP